MDKLRIAVIGLGKMGLLHSSILSAMPAIEIASLCDKSFILRRFAKKLFKSARVVNDVENLSDLEIDCAYVTAPIPAHFPIINALYSRGITKNVFVEKTLSSSWDKANELCSLSENAGGVNMVGYMKRFAVTFSKAKSLLADCVLGELISFNGYAYSSDFSGFSQASKASLSRGGVLSDLGSHIIDLALWFFGDFEVDEATLKSVVDKSCEDCANFTVRKSGLAGQFNISWCMENYRMPNFGLSIKGSNGNMKVDDYSISLEHNDGRSYTWYRHDLNDHVNFLLGEPEYYREDEHFIKSILNSDKAEPSFRTASKVDYIIDQVKKEA